MRPYDDERASGLDRFRQELARRWNTPFWKGLDLAIICMAYVSTLTALTGLIYLLPGSTFALSPSFAWMRTHGGETFWGWLIWSIGLLGLVATFLEYLVVDIEVAGTSNLPPRRVPSRIFGRLVWLATTTLWIFVAWSFLVTTTWPPSPGAVNYALLAVFSQVVAATAKSRRDRGSGEGNGGG